MSYVPEYSHLNPDRISPMETAINEFDGPIKLLEIGTWTADGSTQLWFKHLKPGSSIMLIDVWHPYCHNDYNGNNGGVYKAVDDLAHKSFVRTFDNVVKFQETNKEVDVTIVRADSNKFLQCLADKTFDFIYIDGCHYYSKVNADIIEAKRLIKDTGVICGDDLEQPAKGVYVDAARNFPENDYISVDGTGHMIHPGVTLAVYENFNGDVNLVNGFWWLYHNNGTFSKERTF